MIIANPENGEVHRVGPGEAAFFQRDTWHHVFNPSDGGLRVLELFAPPPATGSSGAYAHTRPLLDDARYARPEAMTAWPRGPVAAGAGDTIQVIRRDDWLWSLQGQRAGGPDRHDRVDRPVDRGAGRAPAGAIDRRGGA